jgi:drug/metabolite transporter (DMT)-like permease
MLVAMILVSVGLAALAQLTLKAGMNQVTEANGGAVTLSGDAIRTMLTNLTVWAGLVLFGLSAVVWLFVLSRTSLSFAYPFAALTYLLIVLVDRFVLHEAVPAARWAGVACIMIGIVLVARTAPA